MEIIGFWRWLNSGSGGKPGYTRILNRWLWVHLIVGVGLAYSVPYKLDVAANTILVPLIGILVGLTFSWAGNAQALMQTEEMFELSKHHPGGFVEYVYIYQLAILTILICLIFWTFAGLHVFDSVCPETSKLSYFSLSTLLYSTSSLTIRVCWHVVTGAHWMLIAQREVKKLKKNKHTK